MFQSEYRKAKLFAQKKERIMLPRYNVVGGGKRIYPIGEFLSQPSGVLALLNTSVVQNFEALDSNTYRCTLPRLNLLNFDVAPVLDLQVTPTDEDCMVEMLSCKFEGSELWSGKMTIFQIYTQPFTMLPTSAVEAPGTGPWDVNDASTSGQTCTTAPATIVARIQVMGKTTM